MFSSFAKDRIVRIHTSLAVVLTMTMAGVASAFFLDDFEEPTWSDDDTVIFNNGYTDDGGIGLEINSLDGIASSQGMIATHESVWGRTVHAGEIGGSTTSYVSGYLRAVAGQAGLKLTDNSADQLGYEAEITFFGGNDGRVETLLELDNVSQGVVSTDPGAFDFDALSWIQAEIGYTGGTTLSARWRDVDDNGANPGAWNSIGFAAAVPASSVFEYGGFRLQFSGRADDLRISATPVSAPIPPAIDFTWNSTESGDWNSLANWSRSGTGSPGTSGSFANHTAIFGDKITANWTVVSNIGVSVRGITFDSANSYAIAGHGPVNLVEGTQVLPQNLTGDSSIAVIQGSHQFQLPVELQNSTDVDVASNSELTFVNTVSLNGNTLTKTGDGNLLIGSVLNTGNGTLDCLQGTCSGSGTIGGDLNNAGGTISPGSSLSASVVPEPSTFILAVGALSLALVRRWWRP